jgi:hypothetical protein
MRTTLVLANLFAVFVASCSDPALPGGRDLISFSATRQDTAVVEAATATPGARQITVRGGFIAPNGCQEIQPVAESDRQNITVTMTALAQPITCTIPNGHFAYLAVIGNYAAGTYRVRVTHRDARGTRTAFDGNVTLAF